MRRSIVTVVPRPARERTFSVSIKLSMMVKPIPLRSSPPVVNMGALAFSISSMPQPQSRTVISIELSSKRRRGA
jgi:hypothetical protein